MLSLDTRAQIILSEEQNWHLLAQLQEQRAIEAAAQLPLGARLRSRGAAVLIDAGVALQRLGCVLATPELNCNGLGEAA